MAIKRKNKPTESPKPVRKTRKPDPEAKAPAEPSNRDGRLTIVGIGASAGGLDALGSFFDALSPDTGMAFVVVTHLHPEHESHMAELLQKHTPMPTKQVTRRIKVEPNHVYVIPPNRTIILTNAHLDIAEFQEPHGHRTPIDHFFRSLAGSQHESVAIVLSGGGTDGAVGVKDIKEVGGLLMVQHPDDAEYDSMPRAAINTGLTDVILPASQLAEKLVEYTRHGPKLPHDPGQLSEQQSETLQRILMQVHARTGHDFNHYKRSTILRRVARRALLNGFETLESYFNYLRHNAKEATALFNDILIGVTNFFRDHDSWKALEENVIPALFEKKKGEAIRVWSVGCATGEEAYGMAILLSERAAKLDIHPDFQIFASDLDENSILHAREGLYPAAIEADVSPERLERFFTREGEYYRVRRELRDSVLFTHHNVLRDPPFSRQDLIACRNVLIYLERDVQDKVFDIFHYALNQYGYLFLGSSESAEYVPELFSVVDKTHRIYQAGQLHGEKRHVPYMSFSLRRSAHTAESHIFTQPQLGQYYDEFQVSEEQHQKALESYGPPSIIINERYTILHVSESAGRYLLQPKGPITGDLLKLVRTELQLELRTSLFLAFEKGQTTISRPVAVQFNGHPRRVIVSVHPQPENLGVDRPPEKQALVFFLEDQVDELVEAAEWPEPRNQAEREKLVAQLEAEVQRLREQLQITIEEYNSSNEEMKAGNEELQSINEEYRSATEELETSKEELQSVNEELQTVNNEMRNKLDEISRAHQELENLMGATEIATLFLDRELRIQRYTSGVKELFNIIPIDRGRRISDLTHRLGYIQFMEDAEEVMHKLAVVEREVQTDDNLWLLIRMRPYRTMEGKVEGLAITFIDITKLKQTERELVLANESLEERVLERTHELDKANRKSRQARDLFYGLFNANPIPTVLISIEHNTFLNVNAEFLTYFGLQRENVINKSAKEVNLSLGLQAATREEWGDEMKRRGIIRNLETEIQHTSGEKRNLLASVQYIDLEETEALIATFIDITERVRAERQIRELASRLTAAEQEERHRISQILHDDLQQRLFAIKTQLSLLFEEYESKDVQALKMDLSEMDAALADAISIARNLSVDLSPMVLHGEGLSDAISWLATRMQDQYGLKVRIKPDHVNSDFGERLRVALFQAVRELLFNVVKHAGTLEADVEFMNLDNHVRITISDQGKGFDAEQTMSDPKAANGLLSLRHRLNLMGCNMDVDSKPGEGTRVMVYCPKPL